MSPRGLIDTGFMLALLDRRDNWHTACVKSFKEQRYPFLTSIAVLTELFYLVGEEPGLVGHAFRFLRSGAVTIGAISDGDLPALEKLMHDYRDRPMDFADATLVLLARRESLSTILTVDNDDFETYRIEGRRRFRILPGRQ